MMKKTILEAYRIRKPVVTKNKGLRSTKNLNETIAGVTFMAGLVLAILMINLYRITIIPWQPIFYITLTTGLLLSVSTRNTKFITESFSDVNRNIFYIIFYYTGAVAIPINYTFLAINYYFAFPETAYQSFLIKEKSSMPGGKGHRTEREPLVRFDYHGQEKELVFAYSQTSQVAAAHRVGVTIRKGRLRFDIIQLRELLN